jgi:hypothetical protein
MRTTCTNCGCAPKKCGCQDTMLTTPTAYPTPVGCPEPAPCSEVFDAQCIFYTGPDIMCGDNVLIATNTNLADALQAIVTQLCTP